MSSPEKKGDIKFEKFAYKAATSHYLEAVDEGNESVYFKLASCFRLLNQPEDEVKWFSLANSNKKRFSQDDCLRFAEALHAIGQYEQAKIWFKNYLDRVGNDPIAEAKLKSLSEIKRFYELSEYIRVKGESFNTEFAEFSPILFKDKLYFVSNRPFNPNTLKFQWDETAFLDAYEVDTVTKEVSRFYEEINTDYHEGPMAFLNEKEVLFTRTNFVKGKLESSSDRVAKLKLFTAMYSEELEEWEEPEEFPFNSDEYSTGHPTLGPNNQSLYFISDRKGGKGGTDLYVSYMKDSVWQEPVSLGDKINTAGNEMFPFYKEGLLFFASNGHGGLGGLDLFVVDLKDEDLEVKNLGAPLNTSKDDFGIYVIETLKKGYISSNREGGKGLDDVYYFDTDIPIGLNYKIRGKVIDSFTGEHIAWVPVNLQNKNSEINQSAQADSIGGFQLSTKPKQKFLVTASNEGYLPYVGEVDTEFDHEEQKEWSFEIPLVQKGFSIQGVVLNFETLQGEKGVKIQFKDRVSKQFLLDTLTLSDGYYGFKLKEKKLNDALSYVVVLDKEGYLVQEYNLDIQLDRYGVYDVQDFLNLIPKMIKPEVGMDLSKKLELKPIYFDLDKSNIRPDASLELDKVVTLMKNNPDLKIELGAHTDSRANYWYNYHLSVRRARSTAKYITENGVKASRIRWKGHGETKLVNDCKSGVECTEDAHQLNRRTEIIVIDF